MDHHRGLMKKHTLSLAEGLANAALGSFGSFALTDFALLAPFALTFSA